MTISIDNLGIDVPVEHPRRRGPAKTETISVHARTDALWVWDEECQLQSEIYLFEKRDPRFGRHLAEIPHLDAIHRAITEHAVAQRANLIGSHLQHAVQALEAVIAERDGSSVYFADAGGHIKIGWSRKVSTRLAQLQTGSAVPIRLLGTMPGGRAAEQRIHEQFAHLRISGEWFIAAPELLAFVAARRAEHQAQLAAEATEVS
jgi:hypothetical protein